MTITEALLAVILAIAGGAMASIPWFALRRERQLLSHRALLDLLRR